MVITFPTDTESIIDGIRGAIGRDTYWYTLDSKTECPTCGVDPVTDTALDSFCPTCSGVGYIINYLETAISGHITWGYSEELGWQTGGTLDEGECRVQIKYTPENITIVDNVEWVIVDGKKMQFIKKILRGVQNINRILVDLKEKEE
jgi:hypothetical protein